MKSRNMYMSEDYNSPQSPYWCMKTLIAVALAESDDFWAAEELPYPAFEPPVKVLPGPQQILCNHPRGNHHFMLAPGQFAEAHIKAKEAKYCKFAYSSAFAFSVPTGPAIHQIAPDSQLYLSRDGAETWRTRGRCEVVVFDTAALRAKDGTEEEADVARVRWCPWGDGAVSVDTVLIPPTDRWPDWHVRVHRIRCLRDLPSLETVEGGFALHGRTTADGRSLPKLEITGDAVPGHFEGIVSTDRSTLISSFDGASGVVMDATSSGPEPRISSRAMRPDPNTNLVRQRTLIPTGWLEITDVVPEGTEIFLITSVFAVASGANDGWHGKGATLRERWLDCPRIDPEEIKAQFDKGSMVIGA